MRMVTTIFFLINLAEKAEKQRLNLEAVDLRYLSHEDRKCIIEDTSVKALPPRKPRRHTEKNEEEKKGDRQ